MNVFYCFLVTRGRYIMAPDYHTIEHRQHLTWYFLKTYWMNKIRFAYIWWLKTFDSILCKLKSKHVSALWLTNYIIATANTSVTFLHCGVLSLNSRHIVIHLLYPWQANIVQKYHPANPTNTCTPFYGISLCPKGKYSINVFFIFKVHRKYLL